MPLLFWGAVGVGLAYLLFWKSGSASASSSASSWTGPIANTMVTGSLTGQNDAAGNPLMQSGFTAPDCRSRCTR